MQTAKRPFLLVMLVACTLLHVAAQDSTKKEKKKKAKAEPVVLDPFGRPEGQINDQPARYYVWFENKSWKLRTTAKVGRNFTGTIRLKDAKVKSCLSVGLKKDNQKKTDIDRWQVNEARNELRFQFKTSTLADGFDLEVDGDDGQIEFELMIDNQKNPKAVFVGRGLQHPDTNPFSLPAIPKKMSPP
jgi:hypothetical protein